MTLGYDVNIHLVPSSTSNLPRDLCNSSAVPTSFLPVERGPHYAGDIFSCLVGYLLLEDLVSHIIFLTGNANRRNTTAIKKTPCGSDRATLENIEAGIMACIASESYVLPPSNMFFPLPLTAY